MGSCLTICQMCRLLIGESWSTREAFHQPTLIGSCLTVCQTCLSCPPSGQIQLNVGAWRTEKKMCRLLTAKSRSGRRASHQPAFIGSYLTIGQIHQPCPTSRQTWLNVGKLWAWAKGGRAEKRMPCAGTGKRNMSKVSLGLWYWQ